MPSTIVCRACGHKETTERVGFRDECERCHKPLHTCRHCTFFLASAYNQCAEPNAERVLDKDNANKCDYFRPASAGGAGGGGGGGNLSKTQADDLLKSLFKK